MADETKKISWLGGTHIEDAARDLVEAVAAGASEALGEFNDITLTAKPGTTAAEIETFYHVEMAARAEAYRKSPAGIKDAADREEATKQGQALADALMAELETLDISDSGVALDWLCRFQGPSDDIGVRKDAHRVVQTFVERGYGVNVNLGDEFNENDRENYARYIIGQALHGLQHIGAIHGMVGVFRDRWAAKHPALSRALPETTQKD